MIPFPNVEIEAQIQRAPGLEAMLGILEMWDAWGRKLKL